MSKYISFVLALLISVVASHAENVDVYQLGDSICVPIYTKLTTLSAADTIDDSGTKFIGVNRYFMEWNSQAPAHFLRVNSYNCREDSLRHADFPVRPVADSGLGNYSIRFMDYYVYRDRADFACKTGTYVVSWILYLGAATKLDRGMYVYRVTAPDKADGNSAAQEIKEELRQGVQWSPFGERYGIEAFSGNGPHICSIHVLSSADSSAITKCDIRILGANGSATEGLWFSNNTGLANFSLMDGGYRIIPFKSGYTFPESPYSLDVEGTDVSDTLWGQPFDPGNPPLAELCRVYGWVYGAGYDSLMGVTVQAKIKQSPVRVGSVVISPYEKQTATDSSGYWYLDLIPNEDITPEGTEYQFTIYYSSGTVVRKEITVPRQSSWEFGW